MVVGRSTVIRAAVAAVVAVWGSVVAARQASAPSASEGRPAYHLVKDWAPTPPYPTHDWEMSSVTVDPDGRRVYAAIPIAMRSIA